MVSAQALENANAQHATTQQKIQNEVAGLRDFIDASMGR
jgi:hypothetical protein